MTTKPATPPEWAEKAKASFWSKVEKSPNCWKWLGAKNSKGYGRFDIGNNGKRLGAHRIAYALSGRPLSSGQMLDHLCRNRDCVNPAHLEIATNRENVLRGVSFAAQNSRKTHCPKGHEYTPNNTLLRRSGTGHIARFCKACALAHNRKYHANHREQQNMKRKQNYLRSLGEKV